MTRATVSPTAGMVSVRIALAARHVANLHRVGQDQRDLALEDVPDRLPVDARRLHRDMGAAMLGQPIRQREQLGRRRAECPHVRLDRCAVREAYARHDRLLMDIQTRTPRIEHLHRDLLVAPARSPRDRNLEGVLSGPRPVATVWGARGAPGPTDIRAQGTTDRPTSMLARPLLYRRARFMRSGSGQRVAG